MTDSHWYAIQLSASAHRTRRTGRSIECAMKEAGITYWSPFELRRVIHKRTKAVKEKRFPMLPGYGFVYAPGNWMELMNIKGVLSVLGSHGNPVPIPKDVIGDLMLAEQAVNEANKNRWRMLQESKKRITRRKMTSMYPVGATIKVKPKNFQGEHTAVVTATTGRKTVKAMMEFLGGQVAVELGVDDITDVVVESAA